jgi:signal transduction histidine kinase/ActR/RegA family two-component response regulator
MTPDDRVVAVFDAAPVYLTVVEGPDLRVTMVNRRVREEIPQMLGRTAPEIYSPDNPIVLAVQRVYETGTPETIHALPLYFPDRVFAGRYFTRRIVPLRNDRGVYGVLILGYEVTEEVRAREEQQEVVRRSQLELHRLGALLEEAPALIGVLEGPELRLVMMNRRLRELFAGRNLLGVSFHDIVPPSNSTLMAACRVYATGVAEALDVVVRDVAGLVGRSFSTTVVPIREEDGTITRIMTVSLETTEQRRAQEVLEAQARDLEIARRQAVEASRTKDDFLAMLGHELRNPLAPIAVTLEVMRLQGRASPEVELLDRQVRHLVRLVDDLLDVSRIARGLVELKCRHVELSRVVARALEMAGPLVEQRQQRIVSDLAPASVHGDPDRLAQVVANLITNAAKYSEAGAEIRIRTERSGERARVIVADDGVGIAPEMLAQVFDAFVQQQQTLERSGGGLGLGLSIVKGLVEAHAGTVSAHSDGVGRGSTFVIDLPASDGPTTQADVSRSPGRVRALARGKRILVVDDNRDAAIALKRALEEMGHIVVIAHDGPEALRLAEAFEPQIGLVDIGLPGMDGYELAGALRAAHDLRLLAITGYGQARDRQRPRDAGFEEHLVKPVKIDELAGLLQRLGAGYSRAE